MIHRTGCWSKQQAPAHHRHSVALSQWICEFLSPDKEARVYDFGCGMGRYLDDLYAAGHPDVVGVEGDPPSPSKPYAMIAANLCEPLSLGKTGVVMSLEVGEHIPAAYTAVYLDNLFRHADRHLLLSWAVRGQGGHGHVNELNNDEVVSLIERNGFAHVAEASMAARTVAEDLCWWFRGSFLVFERVGQ